MKKENITWMWQGRFCLGYYDHEFLFRIKLTTPWWKFWNRRYELAYVPNKEPRFTSDDLDWLIHKANERLNWALKIEANQEKLGGHETPGHPQTPSMDNRTQAEA